MNVVRERLSGKMCGLTGAGSGIGLATVGRFLAQGARVTPLDLYLTRAGDARAQLAASCDITDESSVAAGTIEQLARHREFRRAVDGMHRLGRVANPDEIASVTAFLASDDSAFMSGWAVIVDGGCTA